MSTTNFDIQVNIVNLDQTTPRAAVWSAHTICYRDVLKENADDS